MTDRFCSGEIAAHKDIVRVRLHGVGWEHGTTCTQTSMPATVQQRVRPPGVCMCTLCFVCRLAFKVVETCVAQVRWYYGVRQMRRRIAQDLQVSAYS